MAWQKILAEVLTCGGVLLVGCAATGGNRAKTAPAIQAIQQASDPSAAITAFANGFALDRTDPSLYEAYITRMVDFGLPEMAYHQAQTLTTFQSRNGLAWGVVAYVHARREDMPEAVSAIVLAGQFSPENTFVEHTAGEILAWYDLKADKTKLPDSTKEAVAKVRALVAQRPPFMAAYNAAKTAYEGQPGVASVTPSRDESTPQAKTQNYVTAPLADATSANYPVGYDPYYVWAPGYYYDWGPGWVEPAPWWWWEPIGFFGGCDFFPFGSVVIFSGFDHFHHFHHDHFFRHNDRFRDGGGFDHQIHGSSAFWHHNAQGGTGFFGTPARPSPAVTQWTLHNFQTHSVAEVEGTGAQWWAPASKGSGVSRTLPAAIAAHGSMPGSRRVPTTATRTRIAARTPTSAPAVARHSTGNFQSYAAANLRTSWAAPTYHTQAYSTPRRPAPSSRFLGSHRAGSWNSRGPFHSASPGYSAGTIGRGGFQGGSSFGGRSFGGGFPGGRSFGGGSHGGGFGGGSHGFGGHR